VIVSGTPVAFGLLSMLVLPLPFIRSIGIGGMLIPAVSVITAITLLPALLAVLGTRINSLRLLPKRFVDRGHPEDGLWGRWANFVMRRPVPVAAVGFAIVAVLVFYGVQLNPSEAQAKDFPGTGSAIQGRAALAHAGISPGVMKPFVVLVEDGADRAPIAAKLRKVEGVEAVVALPEWRLGPDSLIEAFLRGDGARRRPPAARSRPREPQGARCHPRRRCGEDRDFVAAVY
jgi:RND superfamily putative drug exporter